MKKILLTLFILFSSRLLANELAWVDEQVNAIKPPRSGMKSRDLRIKNPFIFLQKNRSSSSKAATSKQGKKPGTAIATNKKTKTQKKVLVLGAILNNSVMINGEWYKLGQKVNGYKISEISLNSVLLHNQKKQLLLTTKSSSNKLKFLNK